MGGVAPIVTGVASLMGAQKQKKSIERARREQAGAAAKAQERLSPYQEQGEYATQQIREGLDTGTLGGSFTPGDLASDPGYQFRLEQGEQALGRTQAARGNLYSGQALKEANRFSQGLAEQSYQDAYNRWLQTQQNRYNQLRGQQQTGYGAAGGVGQIDLGEGQSAAQATMARRAAQDRGTSGAIGAGLGYIDQANQGALQMMGMGGGGFGQSMTPQQTPNYVAY